MESNPIPGLDMDESRNLLVHDHAGVSVIAPSAVQVYADKTFCTELRLGLEGRCKGYASFLEMIWNYGAFRLIKGKKNVN